MKPRYPARKSRNPNPSYDKENHSASSNKRPHSALDMRSDHRKKISTTTPVKTSVILNPALLGSAKPDFSHIPTYRPVANVIESSVQGSPVVVNTPAGSTLSRVSRLGAFSLFSNIPAPLHFTPQSRLSNADAFYASPQCQAIKAAIQTVKLQEAIVTPDLLKESQAASSARGGQRISSQAKVMKNAGVSEKKASATDYVEAAELFSGTIKCEWLHLVAHMIWDAKSQQVDNLVAGTQHANTEMLLIESKIPELVKLYPDGVQLIVSAELVEGTHIAKTINYTIKTPDFTLPLTFNAQTTNQPHIDFKEYIKAIIDEMVSQGQQKKSPSAGV